MKWQNHHFTLPLFAWLLTLTYFNCAANPNQGRNHNQTIPIRCIDEEREALLQFKRAIQSDFCGLLTSWTDQECCQWHGVRCSVHSNHVISLDLNGAHHDGSCLACKSLSPSLVELTHLKYLDLSFNNFQGQPIPNFIGSLHSLETLNLSSAKFHGEIPHQLANLSSLVSLQLSNYGTLYAKSLGWLSHLTSLREIDLSGTNLSLATDWMHAVNNLPLLRSVAMEGCGLSTSLNSFHGENWIPNLFGDLCSLQALSLRSNSLSIELSLVIQALSQCAYKSLMILDLHYNNLWGSIPDEIGKFSSLRRLGLDGNQLNGTISPSLGQLSMLEWLGLHSNSLKDTISNHHLSNLSRLSYLDLSGNSELVINISANWIPPFQLQFMDLGSCKLGPHFPRWLLTQRNIGLLNVSNTQISDTIPDSFWNALSSNLEIIDMSRNMIHGTIPNKFGNMTFLTYLDLSDNQLQGPIPNTIGHLSSLNSLHLSHNSLSGTIPHSLSRLWLTSLDLSNNNLTGIIPPNLDEQHWLVYLDLSYNRLSGSVPPQLRRFGTVPFLGNPELNDSFQIGEQNEADQKANDDYDDSFYIGLYVSIAAGFYVGFWGFCSALVLKHSWRHKYFQAIEDVINWVYVVVAIRLAKFRRNSQTVDQQ